MTSERLWAIAFVLVFTAMLGARSQLQTSYHREMAAITDGTAGAVLVQHHTNGKTPAAAATDQTHDHADTHTPGQQELEQERGQEQNHRHQHEPAHTHEHEHAHTHEHEHAHTHEHEHTHKHSHAPGETCIICEGLKATGDPHRHAHVVTSTASQPLTPHDHHLREGDSTETCLVCGSAHQHAHTSVDKPTEEDDPIISTGLVLILRQLGLAELAANLLWLQMDIDSHQSLWHRVEFYLDLIPQVDPHFTEAYLLQAHVMERVKQQPETALQVLETGLSNNPESYDLMLEVGVVYLNYQGRRGPKRYLERSTNMFYRLLQMYPNSPGFVQRFLAISLAASERRDEAINFLNTLATRPGRSERDLSQDHLLIERIQAGEKF